MFGGLVVGSREIVETIFFGGENQEIFDPFLPWLVPILSSYAISTVIIAYFRAVEKIRWYAGLTVLESLSFLFIVFCLLYYGYSTLGVIYSLVISRLIVVAIGLGFLSLHLGFELPRPRVILPYLKYCIPLLPSAFFIYVIQYSDRYILLHYGSIYDVSLYNAAYTFGGIITLIFAPFFQLVTPRVTADWNEEKYQRSAEYLSRAIKYSMTLSAPVVVVIGSFASEIVRLYATREFLVDWPVLVMIVASYNVLMLGALSKIVVMLSKKYYLIMVLEGSSAGLNLVLNFLLIPRFSLAGAAFATLVTFAIQYFAYIKFSKELLSYSINGIYMVKIAAACLGMAASMYMVSIIFNEMVIVAIVVGIFVYVAQLVLMKGFSVQEFETFRGAFVDRVRSGK